MKNKIDPTKSACHPNYLSSSDSVKLAEDRPTTNIKIQGISTEALIDTGSVRSPVGFRNCAFKLSAGVTIYFLSQGQNLRGRCTFSGVPCFCTAEACIVSLTLIGQKALAVSVRRIVIG